MKYTIKFVLGLLVVCIASSAWVTLPSRLVKNLDAAIKSNNKVLAIKMLENGFIPEDPKWDIGNWTSSWDDPSFLQFVMGRRTGRIAVRVKGHTFPTGTIHVEIIYGRLEVSHIEELMVDSI